MDHLLLHCDMAKKIWQVVLGWFQCCWVFPRSIVENFEAWGLALDHIVLNWKEGALPIYFC